MTENVKSMVPIFISSEVMIELFNTPAVHALAITIAVKVAEIIVNKIFSIIPSKPKQ